MEALLEASLRLAAPLLLAALGELIVQRSGVVNIGIEGMMLTGAFAAFAVAVATGSPGWGAASAVGAGATLAAVFAFFAVVRRADQIVVGTAINLLALGATGLALRTLHPAGAPEAPVVASLVVPGLAELPWLGSVLFRQTGYVYGGVLLALLLAWGLRGTRPGLRLRAVGEAARAADAEGVRVTATRFTAVLVGGALAGLAGSALSIDQSSTFTEEITAGRGFIALTIVIFGRWLPFGALGAALLFGAATAMQFRLQARGYAVPYPVFLMLPYVVTLGVLTFASGRARAPADLGRPYRRE